MSSIITKIKLFNYRRFENYTVIPNERVNILVGDNEVGKSSIVEAIDLVSSGNVRRVESIGLERLINIDAVKQFNLGQRTFEKLPVLKVELYLSGENFDFTMCGKNNTDKKDCNGIRLVCEPNPDYRTEIANVLSSESSYFPYDYYMIRFSTFADEGYTGYKKKIRSILIDSSAMNSEYATSDFVRRMYMRYTEQNVKERANHKNSYRQMRKNFQTDSLKNLNERLPTEKHYAFGLKSGFIMGLESELMLYENEIGIDSKGTGKQSFIKTDFALERSGDNVDVILIEEPENHLSPVNLRKLIQRISDTQSGQLFITTHNSLISTRLELNNLLIMHINNTDKPIMLKDLNEETAKYFMKCPPANIIEFALAKKSILVEGPSEYMLMKKFYETCAEGCSPESEDVHIIDVRGLSFKRYIDIANLTGCKVAVITDNDSDHNKHCIEKYRDYVSKDNVNIFFDADDKKYTFEVVLYNDNSELCDEKFDSSALEYMLKNKTEAAYTLLSKEDPIVVPNYIKRGIEWIRK